MFLRCKHVVHTLYTTFKTIIDHLVKPKQTYIIKQQSKNKCITRAYYRT